MKALCFRERNWIFFIQREIEIMEQLNTQEIISIVQVRNGKMKREMVVAQTGAIAAGNDKEVLLANVLDIESGGLADSLLMEDYIR